MGNSNSGRGGLEPAKQAEIERLLAVRPKLKRLEIARQVGVERSTVFRYIHKLKAAGEAAQQQVIRCAGCGGLVYVAELPCRICRDRSRARRKRARLLSLRARAAAKKPRSAPPMEST